MGGMGWRTEDAGVSRLVERYFLHPRSANGESDGWVGGEGGEPCFGLGHACFWLF